MNTPAAAPLQRRGAQRGHAPASQAAHSESSPQPLGNATTVPRYLSRSGGSPALLQRQCAACAAEQDEEAPKVRRQVRGEPLVEGMEGIDVSQPGDADEQEADRAAEAVMRVQREPSSSAAGPPALSGGDGAAAAVPGLHAHGGHALAQADRDFFEPAFGRSFGEVRIHTDAEAANSAQALHARAYTVGRDVAFAPGQYAPATDAGRRLMAHELAHVAQSQAPQRGEGGQGEAAAPVRARGRLRLRRQLCEDPAEIVRNALRPPARAEGGRQGTAPDAPALTGEYLSPAQFEQITGVNAGRLPEDTFVGTDLLGLLPEPADAAAQALASAAGPAALGAPLPMSVIPGNSIGVLWVSGHQSIFASVDGAVTLRGYRANLLVHAGGELLPGSAGLWFRQQLTAGVPGAFRGDLPFAYMNNQSLIYLETDAATAAQFARELRATRYGGDYRYSPPRPDAPGRTERLMYERVYNARGSPRAVLCANNCITVPLREMDVVLGMRPTVGTPAGPLDITSGRVGAGPPNVFERGRAARMKQFMQGPDLSAGRPGLTSVTMTPAAARAVGYIRVGGSVLMVYGLYQSGSKLSQAWGTEEFPLVAMSEGLGWGGGIVGTALGTAAVSALVCAPTGPVTVVCAVGGFLGGLIVGSLGALLGSMIIPVILRTVQGLTEALVTVIGGLVTAIEIVGLIGHGLTRGLIVVPLLAARQRVNPCNWELIGLPSRTQADVMALGLHLWHRLGTVNADTFLERAGRPIRSQGTVPSALLREIAAGLSAAVRAQTGFNIEFTSEFIGNISPLEFVNQMHAYNLLRHRYDPDMLAELMAED